MNPIRIAKNWISYRRTINELGSLSNQALSDIGLTRVPHGRKRTAIRRATGKPHARPRHRV